MMIALILTAGLGLAARAHERPYASLGESLDILGPVAKRLGRRHNAWTLEHARRQWGWALIYTCHPFNRASARQIRRRIAEWNMPDELAVLTRNELTYAELVRQTHLNDRAVLFLIEHQVRTLDDLRALSLEGFADDTPGRFARRKLAALAATCEDTLTEVQRPKT